MFNTNNKNNQSEDQESSIGVSPTSDEVYIMPEKFHAYPKKSSSNKSLFVVVLILVLVVVISASYFIYNSIKNREVEPSQPVSNQNNNNTALGNTNTNSNANANTNVNRDANRNSNINNANENTNANENSNQNSNANTNTNENTNRFIIPTKSTDTDRDGLTDLEEALIGSSTTSPDSDRDGYLDSDELLAGYNPIVNPSSGESFKLEDADFIDELITNFADDNFRILYIKGWSVNLIESLREVRIITATGEMIRVSVIDNEDNSSAASWYLLNNPQVTLSQLDDIESGDLKGVYAPDGLSAYLTDKDKNKFYTFKYDLDDLSEFRYPTIFEMIIRNFEFKGIAVALDDDVETISTSTPASVTTSTPASL